jgi:hypothetical protein
MKLTTSAQGDSSGQIDYVRLSLLLGNGLVSSERSLFTGWPETGF